MSTTHEILGSLFFDAFSDGPATSCADVHIDVIDSWTNTNSAAVTPSLCRTAAF